MSHQEESFVVDSLSPDGKWLCVFEDDGETGYLYFCPMDTAGEMQGIADALWIYNQISPSIFECEKVHIIWSEDSLKAILIVDGEGWGMFDLSRRRKLSAPRIDNSIVSIPLETWNDGIQPQQGEPLNFEVTNE
ncbi:DUF2251 domain-containing protein [Litchfieldia salsa]|uniref:DUF2251 domain-containing protein n=1 Tax=Litchfieldia salsa TaxID=930152 RepID=A0A1H0TYP1_9BACI|nr:DUF2251 domain-containing protein [Litchfieldia salsa]SDP58656.1 hypothetical protein SAMN05216565_1048 [Litchfieldia salsa]